MCILFEKLGSSSNQLCCVDQANLSTMYQPFVQAPLRIRSTESIPGATRTLAVIRAPLKIVNLAILAMREQSGQRSGCLGSASIPRSLDRTVLLMVCFLICALFPFTAAATLIGRCGASAAAGRGNVASLRVWRIRGSHAWLITMGLDASTGHKSIHSHTSLFI